ncbi:MAG: hypothetical protein NTX25_24205, partial [Proteobacteria bacterium]|nr:hypothetical protein [Pseudomonadota bacterium]
MPVKVKYLSIENMKDHRGFSLVAVMVGVGVSLMLAVIIGQTVVNTKAVQKKLESMQGYRDIDQKIINVIGTQFLQKISLSANCIDYST